MITNTGSFKNQAEPVGDEPLDQALSNHDNPEPVVSIKAIFKNIESLWINSSAVELIENIGPNKYVEDNCEMNFLISCSVKVITVLIVKTKNFFTQENEEEAEKSYVEGHSINVSPHCWGENFS